VKKDKLIIAYLALIDFNFIMISGVAMYKLLDPYNFVYMIFLHGYEEYKPKLTWLKIFAVSVATSRVAGLCLAVIFAMKYFMVKEKLKTIMQD
jgi:hypothetical protein